MPNLSALSNATTAITALSNLVVVTPSKTRGYQPQNDTDSPLAQQPPALLFHIEGQNTAVVESDITDHYVEDNTTVQNQIALKPEIVTVDGYIGELNNVVPDFLKPLKFLADKLTTVTAYAPQVSATAQIAYAQAFFLYQVAANAGNALVSAVSALGGADQAVIGSEGLTDETELFNLFTTQNKQQVAFQQFYGYWRKRTLFTVQTPWAVFQNMAIQRLEAIQDESTQTISNFKVTFKMIRKAQIATTAKILSGRLNSQSAPLTDYGTTPVSTNTTSLGSQLSASGIA